MNAGQLHRLARQLREVATRATVQAGEAAPSPGLIAVVEDIARHPESSIGEIVARVKLAQSFVSKIVAELRDEGILSATPDPSDGRRVRVHLASGVRQEVLLPRAGAPLTDTLAALHPELTPEQIARAGDLLDELAALLNPASGGTARPH